MVEVLVLLVFHLVVGGHQRLLELALRLLGDLVDQLPVQVVLRLGFHHALARHELRGVRRRVLVRHFHGFDQRLADVADDQPPRRVQIRIEPKLVHHLEHDALVVASLFEVLLPFLLEVGIHDAGERRRVNLDAAPLGLQRLIQ